MSDHVGPGRGACGCGACRGIEVSTPVEAENRPGLPAIRFRVGDHPRFMDSLLAGLSDGRNPGLRGLSTRSTEDFSVALCDAFATMADVLTFYQERIANESYLGTAVERLSVGQIARLVGYELGPGVAAHTLLAFTFQDGVGAVERLPLPVGTKVQSTPGPNEKPQVFETVEAIEARTAWSRIPVQTTRPQVLSERPTTLRLKGGALNLRPGDGVLDVYEGAHSAESVASYRQIRRIDLDPKGQWTEVEMGPEHARGRFSGVPARDRGVFVFRIQASLFGYNAAPEHVNAKGVGSRWTLVTGQHSDRLLALDGIYRSIVPGGWAVWTDPDAGTKTHILRVESAGTVGIAAYGLSGKVSRVLFTRADGVTHRLTPASMGELRSISISAQSEQVDLSDPPLRVPIRGKTLTLARRVEGLASGRKIAISGKRLQAEILKPVQASFRTRDGRLHRILRAPQVVDLVAFPVPLPDGLVRYHIRLDDRLGLIVCRPERMRYFADTLGTEAGVMAKISGDLRTLTLASRLRWAYDLTEDAVVNANVAEATHGESVRELLGSGDGSQRFQKFTLKQPPLTHVAAATPSGTKSTLQVWVNGIEWHEVPFFYGRGPRERVFTTRGDSEGKVTVQFGDGTTGARLPTGPQNVWATYRKGIGSDGLLKTGQINLLMSRPLGLKDATNPVPSTDAEDPENLRRARRNAPATVLTLDRVVSFQDYEDFTRTFAGIAKTKAAWTWFGEKRGVFLTVAGPKGAEVSRQGRRLLRSALEGFGDRFAAVRVENYRPALFKVGLRVKPDPDRIPHEILAAVEQALRRHYSFEHRDFGEPVTQGELYAVAQGVDGVLAAQVVRLHRTDRPGHPRAGLHAPLVARAPEPGERGIVQGAELLTLDPGPLDLLEILP